MRLRTYSEWLKGQRRWQDIAIEEVIPSGIPGEGLRSQGIGTMGMADGKSDADLLAVPGVGKVTVIAIRRRIHAMIDHERRMLAAKSGGNRQ